MKKITLALSTILLFLPGFIGLSKEKKTKPWTEWMDKDAKKILAESPWAHTQIEPDTAQIFYSATGASGGSATPQGRSALSQPNPANFHIRLLSARPIRQVRFYCEFRLLRGITFKLTDMLFDGELEY